MFRGRFAMNDPCPECGLIFQREEGYFLGAMYASYLLSAVLMVPFFFAFLAVLPQWNGLAAAGAAIVAHVPFIPMVYRYSRVLWVHFDRAVCPSDVSAGAYEKLREVHDKDQPNGIGQCSKSDGESDPPSDDAAN